MKILLDMNLPLVLAEVLIEQGYEVLHWSSIGDVAAPDKVIFEYARDNGYIIFTHDLDFSALLAAAQAHAPSVFQIRTQDVRSKSFQQAMIDALRQFESLLMSGALVVIDESRSRARILPLN